MKDILSLDKQGKLKYIYTRGKKTFRYKNYQSSLMVVINNLKHRFVIGRRSLKLLNTIQKLLCFISIDDKL